MATKTLDEVLTENTQLTADLTTAKQTIGTIQAQVTSLTAEKTTLSTQLAAANASATSLQTNLNTVTSERDTARTELAAAKAEVARLTESQKDFDGKVAAQLAKHGIRPTAAAAEEAPAGKSKLSLTDMCMAAKPKAPAVTA